MQKNLLIFFCCLLSYPLMAQKQVQGNPKLQPSGATILQVDKSPTKLSPVLKNLSATNNVARIQSFSIQAKPVTMTGGLDKYIQYHNGGVVVDITAKGSVSAAKNRTAKKWISGDRCVWTRYFRDHAHVIA